MGNQHRRTFSSPHRRRPLFSLCQAAEKAGVFSFVRQRLAPLVSGQCACVVTFHDVFSSEEELTYGISIDAFEETIRFLKDNFKVVPLREVIEASEGKRRYDERMAAVTFDDGRKSYLTRALPVLSKYGVSSTVFVITKTLDPSFVVWTDIVEQLVVRASSIRLPRYLGYGTMPEASSFTLKRDAVIRLKSYLRYLPARRREAAIRELAALNGFRIEDLRPRGCYLEKEDVRALAKAGVEIGSHGHTHEAFSLLSREGARRELLTSKHMLEEITERPVEYFAFPTGTSADFRPDDGSLAQAVGYRAAFTTVRGVIRPQGRQFLLPRVEAPGGYEELPLSVFSCLLALEYVVGRRRQRRLAALATQRRKMNVLYVIDYLHPEYAGGTETQLESTIRNADRNFVNPFLCLLRGEVPDGFKCPVTVLEVKKLLGPGSVTALFRLSRLMRREKIDVAHLQFFDSVVLGTVAARLSGVPAVISARRGVRSLAGKKLEMFLVRMLDRLTTCILSNSHAVRESVLVDEGVAPRKVLVIHNGIVVPEGTALPPGEAKQKLGLKPRDLSVGLVSNLRFVKGVDVFLRAAAQVYKEEPLARFCVFGEGELRDELQKLVDDLGVAGAVRFMGFSRDAYALMPGFDVAVISSRSEGCSNALLEYCFLGSAVVATDVGGNPEIVVDGRSGRLVESDNPASLSEAILALLGDSHLRTRLGSRAQRDVNEKFLLRDALRQLWCLYWRLLNRDGDWVGRVP
ncbi:MAG: glycosyltransferase [Candidatus Eisenbacteria bacterium]